MDNKMSKLLQKKQKGQILVLLGLLFIGLIAIIGLAIDLGMVFVAYSRLNRGVDAAALAATGEIKRNVTLAQMQASARQLLKLNEVNVPAANITIEQCSNATIANDPELCPANPTDLPRKLVRVTVRQDVQLYFLSVIGIPKVSIQSKAISEAATVDVMLVLDRSGSMTGDAPNKSVWQDPKKCTEADQYGNDSYTPAWDKHPGPDGVPGECHPFEEVKAAAKLFADQLDFDHDRMGIVVTDKFAHMGECMGANCESGFPLSSDYYTVTNSIMAMKPYYGSGLCPYVTEDLVANTVPNMNLDPCRLYDQDPNVYEGFHCPRAITTPFDFSTCTTSNIGNGVAVAGNALGGDYKSFTNQGYTFSFGSNPPKIRDEAVWVVILLSDGNANAGYTSTGVAICPSYTWAISPKCRDKDPYARHTPSQTSLYDADDFARDMADTIVKNSVIFFTVGLGDKLNIRDDKSTASWPCITGLVTSNCSPGQELMAYIATGAASQSPKTQPYTGEFFNVGNDSTQLNKVFLAIANKITTKLTK
jgi:Flp pilus assembly protein TadG